MNSADTCTKCKAPLDTKGYPLWCKVCRAKYKRDYEIEQVETYKSKGFSAGVESLRESLCDEFDRLGNSMFTGYEIAALIRQAPVQASSD